MVEAELLIVGRIKEEISKGMQNMSKEVQKSGKFIQEHGKAIGLAFTAAGAAGLKLVDDAKELNAQLGMTAKDLGITTKEMRTLALETANVTFPVKEVQKSFDLLSRAGLENAEVIADVATTFDTLGDATGKSASEITDMLIPAFKAFKIPLEDASEHVDKFMWLTRNTTVEVSDFARAVEMIAPDMETLGLSIDDVVAMMAAMEAKGISGTMVTRELRTAVSQAAKGEVELMEALGLTTEELAKYTEELKGSTGMTEEYAAIANTQYGIVDKLKHAMSELTLQFGSALEPLEPVLAGMTALGPAMILVTSQIGLQTVKWAAHTIKVWAAVAAHTALKLSIWGPLGLLAGLAALGIYLGTTGAKWSDYTDRVSDATTAQKGFTESGLELNSALFESFVAERELEEQTEALNVEQVGLNTTFIDSIFMVGTDLVKAYEEAKRAAAELLRQEEALRREQERLDESWETFIGRIEHENSAMGELGITMSDLYNYIYELEGASDNLRFAMETWGHEISNVDELMAFFNITEAEAIELMESLREETDKATESFKKLAEARGVGVTKPSFEEFAHFAVTSAEFKASPEYAKAMREAETVEREWGIADLVRWLKIWLARVGLTVGGYERGGTVRETGLAYVHKGETILPAHTTIVVPVYLDGELIAEKVVERAGDEAKLQGVT